MEPRNIQIDDHFFSVIFSMNEDGEVYHETTLDLFTMMKHMAAGAIAGAVTSYWGERSIDEYFIPALEANASIEKGEDDERGNEVVRSSANAFLACVQKIDAYYAEYDKEMEPAWEREGMEKEPSFREMLIDYIRRVIPAHLGD